MKVKFQNKVLMIGCGAVAQCSLPIIKDLIDIPFSNITIMDFVDNRKELQVQNALGLGARYVIDKVTKDNYKTLLSQYVGNGDMIIDLAWDIDTCDMLQWCREQNILYINASFELWEAYTGDQGKHPTEFTLYARHMVLRKILEGWKDNKGATAVLDHGANPGLISHLAKQGLEDIANKLISEKPTDARVPDLKKYLAEQNFSKLAQLEGVKTIHISERDTQITSKPKKVNEFVNTWSVLGIYEEAVAPAELGWGTHERFIPKGAMFHREGPKNQICLRSKGMKTWVRSWVPCGEITGMVIRHGEAFSISEYLTVSEGGKPVYRPTVHYAYCCSDMAVNSLHELEMRQYDLQKAHRIVNDDITEGNDELGCLLMGHDFNSWWIGSVLDIHEARKLAAGQNATTVQVAIGVVAAVCWMIQNPREGVCLPEQLPHKQILETSKPYLGKFISQAVDWTPVKSRKNLFLDYGYQEPKPEDTWQFTTFLVDPYEVEELSAAEYEEVRS